MSYGCHLPGVFVVDLLNFLFQVFFYDYNVGLDLLLLVVI